MFIVPDWISACEVTDFVWAEFKVFVFEPATVLLTVASILTLWPAKFAPKSKFKVFDFGIFTVNGEPNMGLGRFKEKFGASGIVRDTIELNLDC